MSIGCSRITTVVRFVQWCRGLLSLWCLSIITFMSSSAFSIVRLSKTQRNCFMSLRLFNEKPSWDGYHKMGIFFKDLINICLGPLYAVYSSGAVHNNFAPAYPLHICNQTCFQEVRRGVHMCAPGGAKGRSLPKFFFVPSGKMRWT